MLVSAVTSSGAYPTTHSSGSFAGAPSVGKQADQEEAEGQRVPLDIYGFVHDGFGLPNFGTIDSELVWARGATDEGCRRSPNEVWAKRTDFLGCSADQIWS